MSKREVDQAYVFAQLGRSPRAQVEIGARCRLGLPVVVVVPPLLETGAPFPTRYWLSCPLAHRRISRLEAQGGVRVLDVRATEDASFGAALDRAHERYADERDRALSEDLAHRPRGGIGGARAGVKCLHAHFADHAVGNDNPVGAEVARVLGQLDCAVPCVEVDGAKARRNPAHREPAWSVPDDWPESLLACDPAPGEQP